MIHTIKKLPRKRRPEPYENLTGYILRHTELMGWEKITWLLEYASITKDNRHHTPYSFIFDSSLDLSVLGHVTCTDPSQLYPMLYPSEPNDDSMASFMGQTVFKYAISTTRPKICPQCLKQGNYIRAVWDLSLVTCCPIHQCLLVDSCPQCNKKLSWYRSKISGCVDDNKCKFDFRDAPSSTIDSAETYLSAHIYSLLKLEDQQSPLDNNNPVKDLSLIGLISMVSYFGRKYGLDKPMRNAIRFSKGTTCAQRHRALQVISPIICQWPDEFFQLLDDLRAQKHGTRHKYGLSHDFGRNNIEGLKEQLFDGEFDFIRKAFEKYISSWDNGYITSRNKWFKDKDKQIEFVGIEQASSMLNVKSRTIDYWIKHGKLKANVIKSGQRRMIQIDRHSIERLSEDRLAWRTIEETASIYNMTPDFVRDLIRAEIIKPASGPSIDGLQTTRIRYEDIIKLYYDIFQVIFDHGFKPKSRQLVCFKKAYRLLKYKKYSWLKFVQLILSAEIIPYAIGGNAGLNCFLFDERQIRGIRDQKKNDLAPGEMSVDQVSNSLGLSCSAIYKLIKVGYLEAERLPGYKRLFTISVCSVDTFETTYTIAYKLASQFGMHIHRLNYLLKARGIHPAPRRCFDDRSITLYRKKDIDRIDLSELKEK